MNSKSLIARSLVLAALLSVSSYSAFAQTPDPYSAKVTAMTPAQLEAEIANLKASAAKNNICPGTLKKVDMYVDAEISQTLMAVPLVLNVIGHIGLDFLKVVVWSHDDVDGDMNRALRPLWDNDAYEKFGAHFYKLPAACIEYKNHLRAAKATLALKTSKKGHPVAMTSSGTQKNDVAANIGRADPSKNTFLEAKNTFKGI